LEQVEKVNSFSRSLKDRTLSYQEAMAGLKDIAALDGYGYVLKLIVAGSFLEERSWKHVCLF